MDTYKTTQLSKVMSFALRHNPEEYGLSLDEEGWVDLTMLVAAIAQRRRWRTITEADVRYIVETSDKQRFELAEQSIRARYGHSQAARLTYERVVPPEILYHGTPRRNLDKIRQSGLKAMARQYVHLSATIDMALNVGQRRDGRPALLEIRAAEAHAAGIAFGTPSGENDNVYLVASLPAKFIKFPPDENL